VKSRIIYLSLRISFILITIYYYIIGNFLFRNEKQRCFCDNCPAHSTKCSQIFPNLAASAQPQQTTKMRGFLGREQHSASSFAIFFFSGLEQSITKISAMFMSTSKQSIKNHHHKHIFTHALIKYYNCYIKH